MQVYRLSIGTDNSLTGKGVRIAVTSAFRNYLDILVSERYGYLSASEIILSDIEVDSVHIVVADSLPRIGLNNRPIYILPHRETDRIDGYLYAKRPDVKPPTTPQDKLSGCLLMAAKVAHLLEINNLDVDAVKSILGIKSSPIIRDEKEDIFDEILRGIKN